MLAALAEKRVLVVAVLFVCVFCCVVLVGRMSCVLCVLSVFLRFSLCSYVVVFGLLD